MLSSNCILVLLATVCLCHKAHSACVDPSMDNRTFEEGQSWTNYQCVTYECASADNLTVIDSRCLASNNSCVDIGSKGFPCKEGNDTYDNCQCVEGDDELAETLPGNKAKCSDPNMKNRTFTEGDEWTNFECTTYTCLDTGKLKLLGSSCVANNNTCVAIGSKGFDCTVGNKTYDNCSCNKTDSGFAKVIPAEKVKCYDPSLNRTFVEGQSWTNYECTSYQCLKTGRLNLTATQCPSSNRRCMPVGSKGFPCQGKEEVYDNCLCKFDEESGKAKLYYINTRYQCKDSAGTLKQPGDYWFEPALCATYKCDEKQGPIVVENGCRDEELQCFQLNQRGMPCKINGLYWQTCVCQLVQGIPMIQGYFQ